MEEQPVKKEYFEDIADKYNFKSSEYMFSASLEKENKVFLAMLDDYMSPIDSPVFEKEELEVLDFGSGYMPYMDAYRTFFERFKRENKDKRKANIVSWDSDTNIPLPAQSGISNVWLHLESRNEVEKILKKLKIAGFDVVTMFGVGPSSYITNPEDIEESYQKAINALSAVLPSGGLIILTTSFGGPERDNLIEYLKESDLEVITDEPNKYVDILSNKLGFTHDEIIIAIKKAEKEIELEEIEGSNS